MKKLSLLRAAEEVTKAYQTVAISEGQYRFGQALWNNLYGTEFSGLMTTMQMDHQIDFFYLTDVYQVLDLFYKHFVEPVPEGANAAIIGIDFASGKDYTAAHTVTNPKGE